MGDSRYERRGRTRLSPYLLLGGLLGLRRLLLFLATFFRGTLLGSRTLLLGYLRGHALGREWLVVLRLEQRTLPLQGVRLEHLRLLRSLLLEGALAL